MKGCRKIPIHLFRTFPSGMAGLGLFLLRVITALTLGYSGYSLLEGSTVAWFSFTRIASILLPLLGVLMIFGLATMLSGILSCALLIVSFGWLHPRSNSLSAIAAGLSLVLMLLGPGAYSLDARLFGWRRIEIARHTPKPKP
jgi:uncharacterized membrane protein YphA (DoxX/SURF4 family)